jgi:PAS domain S-box-containing protein
MENTIELQEKLLVYQRENEELRNRVDELTDFFENASIPLHWVDGNGVIIWANQAELDALGYNKEEYIGYPISDFHADAEIITDILNRLINNETLYDYSARLKCKDGSIKHVLINSNVLRKDGKFIHTRCFTRDVTEKREEEKRKSDFVSMVSHELKTPLTSINAYVQLLKRKSINGPDDSSLGMLSKIEAQAKKMVTMADDFLNLSKIESGKIQLRRENFDLLPVISEIVREAQLLNSKHAIHIQCADGIPLYADRDKIAQVISNLLSNAIKYSPNVGTITIGCEIITDKVKIFVSDQGMGISSVDQKKLFDPFYRVQNSRYKNQGGFGIGLYFVAEILRHHGSKIEVESEPEKGSTFCFYMLSKLSRTSS